MLHAAEIWWNLSRQRTARYLKLNFQFSPSQLRQSKEEISELFGLWLTYKPFCVHSVFCLSPDSIWKWARIFPQCLPLAAVSPFSVASWKKNEKCPNVMKLSRRPASVLLPPVLSSCAPTRHDDSADRQVSRLAVRMDVPPARTAERPKGRLYFLDTFLVVFRPLLLTWTMSQTIMDIFTAPCRFSECPSWYHFNSSFSRKKVILTFSAGLREFSQTAKRPYSRVGF